jgi:hypothetical protein
MTVHPRTSAGRLTSLNLTAAGVENKVRKVCAAETKVAQSWPKSRDLAQHFD